LVEIEGDEPEDFFEHSGLIRDRAVPDKRKPWMAYHEFESATSIEQVNQIVDECIRAGQCSLDLETEGLDNRINYREDGTPETVHKVVGYCISYDGHTGWYIPVGHRPSDGGPDVNVRPRREVEAAITRLCQAAIPEGTPEAKEADPLSYKCERPKLVIYFWNAHFDHEFLYPVTGIDWWHPDSFEDGMLACFCLHAGDKNLSLKTKARTLLKDPDGNPYEMTELKDLFSGKSKNIRFALLSPDEPGVTRYAGSDAICTFKLCELPEIVPAVRKKHAYTYRIEKQVSNVLRIMERSRVRINRGHVRQLMEQTRCERDALLGKIKAFSAEYGVDLDPNSPKQLSTFLFEPRPKGLDISPKPERNEASKQYKTDGDTLEELAKLPHAPGILKDIVKYRELEKFLGTYLIKLSQNPDENDEIRVGFKQTGAASGRFSAPAGKPEHGYSGVPVHGIPGESELRRDFITRTGYTMVKADYAGEELRIAANITGEPVWITEFLTGSGDLHSITARAFFGKQDITKEERSMGKTANFALLYGGGPQAVVRATGCDVMEAKRRKAAFDKAVPTFAAWIKEQHRKVKDAKGVHTAFGRWLALPDATNPDPKIRSAVERHSVNYQIQGAGADIMKICLIMLAKKFHRLGWLKSGGGDDSVRLLLTVHDEVVFEIRDDRVTEAIPLIVDCMEYPWLIPQTPKWRVPLVVEPLIGLNWKSGYAAERARTDRHIKLADVERVEQGIPLRKFEVLVNGFIYSTTREPKKDKNTREIVETLDRQEQLEGTVFRIIDPPWLVGAVLPPPSGTGDEPPMTRPGSTEPPKELAEAAPVAPVAPREWQEVGPTQRVVTYAEPPAPTPAALEKIKVTLQLQGDRVMGQLAEIVEATRAETPDVFASVFECSGMEPVWEDAANKEGLLRRLIERNLVRERDLY
jgi:DNA polymerase-1